MSEKEDKDTPLPKLVHLEATGIEYSCLKFHVNPSGGGSVGVHSRPKLFIPPADGSLGVYPFFFK